MLRITVLIFSLSFLHILSHNVKDDDLRTEIENLLQDLEPNQTKFGPDKQCKEECSYIKKEYERYKVKQHICVQPNFDIDECFYFKIGRVPFKHCNLLCQR